MSTTEERSLAGRHLLIVEDDWLLQNLLTNKLSALKTRGVAITSAFDGEKAVEEVRKQKPDVILLDILLPGMTGFEFLKHMQGEDPTFKDIPVIVFSNLSSESDREKAHALGVREFIHKSDSTIEEISLMIESVLDTYAPNKELPN
ncbi:MAG: response regulator [Patescibacteria group bacterium]